MDQSYSSSEALSRDIQTDLVEANKAQQTVQMLGDLHESLDSSPNYTLETAFALESLGASFGLETYYSATPKAEKKQIAMESIANSIKDTIVRGLKYIVNLIAKFINWLRGKSNSELTKQNADWLEKTVQQVMTESTRLITLGFHKDISKVVDKDHHVKYFRKLNDLQWSIFNDGRWSKLNNSLADYLIKEHIVKELLDHANSAHKWHADAYAKHGEEDEPLTEEFKRQMTGETSHIVQSVAAISGELKRMYGDIKQGPNTTDSFINHLSIDAITNLVTASHATKRVDFVKIAESREGELRSLFKIKDQCVALQVDLDREERKKKMTSRGWYIYNLHQRILMELTSVIHSLADCYDILENYFRMCVWLFVFCQDYYIDTHALLVRGGRSEDDQVNVHMLKMTDYRDQLKKLLNTPIIRFS